MRKFLKSFCFFAIISVLFYFILLYLWGNYAPSFMMGNLNYRKGSNAYTYTRLKEVEKFGKVDVLFLGSSHTYRGFDPRIFEQHGIKSFNLGSSAQSHIQTNLLLKRYLDKLKPDIIIYDVYPNTFCIDGVESSLNIIANSPNDILSLKMVINQNHMKVYNTFFFGIMNDFIKGNNTSLEETDLGDDKYVKGGYVAKKIKYNSAVIDNTKKLWDFNESQLEAFNENIKLIKERKVKLILVQVPYSHSLYNSYLNNNAIDTLMRKYGEYYNYNEILPMNDSVNFYDADHLNQLGVNIFNETLINQLFKK